MLIIILFVYITKPNFTFPFYGQRCVGFMMAKMVLQELMDPLIFAKLKSFLAKVLTGLQSVLDIIIHR